MTLLTVVQDVCAAVGVDRPTSVFSNINYNRTMAEMLALANEMAQRIAYDGREWSNLVLPANLDAAVGSIQASFNQMQFVLPADYKRLLLATDVWRSDITLYPLRFISDQNEWLRRRHLNWFDPRGEWTFTQGKLFIAPVLFPAWANSHSYAIGDKVYDGADLSFSAGFWRAAVKHVSPATGTFTDAKAANPSFWTSLAAPSGKYIYFGYLGKNCVLINGGNGYGDSFIDDTNTFRLDERLLKLGMIWQWKANKGSPYAEDLGTFNDTMAIAMGTDKPAPIIVGRLPISAAARVGYPFPIDPGMVPL